MQAKAIFLLILVATLAVDNGDAWGWVKKAWNGAKKLWHGAKRIWNKYPLVRTAASAVGSWLGDMREIREMDDKSYNNFMADLEEDVANNFDEEVTFEFVNAVDDIKQMTDVEFRKLETLVADQQSKGQKEMTDHNPMNYLSLHLEKKR